MIIFYLFIYLIHKLPLPSITFCPENNINRAIIDLYQSPKYYTQNTTLNWFDIQNVLSFLCDSRNYSIESSHLNLSSDNIINEMKDLSIETTCTFILYALRLSYREECKDTIQKIVTHEGVCWVYNQLPANKIYQPNVYEFYRKYLILFVLYGFFFTSMHSN